MGFEFGSGRKERERETGEERTGDRFEENGKNKRDTTGFVNQENRGGFCLC